MLGMTRQAEHRGVTEGVGKLPEKPREETSPFGVSVQQSPTRAGNGAQTWGRVHGRRFQKQVLADNGEMLMDSKPKLGEQEHP